MKYYNYIKKVTSNFSNIFFSSRLCLKLLKMLTAIISIFLLATSTTSATTFYSYQTGNWETPNYTWTLDPSGTIQTGNAVPVDNDIVVILSGRTVSLSTDNNSVGLNITIESGGFLNIASYQFTNGLLALNGQGTFRLASSNLPNINTNTIINNGGGTIEFDNTVNFNLPSALITYNNLTINTSTGVVATQLGNITLNGNLHVENGTFQINDNASTVALSLTINKSVTVDNGGSITVGNGVTNTGIGGSGGTAPFLNYYTNFHTIIVKGDFTNNGTVKFTNLPYPVYNAFPPTIADATTGAASVYFQGTTNNTLTCNGTTIFYNLIVNKGIDQTFQLTINSSSYANFKIYGANSLDVDGSLTGTPNQRKALWIYTGTLVLKGSIMIPSLSEGTIANSEFYIPTTGALIISGVDVIVFTTSDNYQEINAAYNVSKPNTSDVSTSAYGSMIIFGRLEIDNGYFSTRESEGIITNSIASGQFVLTGGTVDTKQFLATGSASYKQTGGTLILRGRFQRTPTAYTTIANLADYSIATLNTARATNGIQTNGSFSLNTTTSFAMAGGTIRIYDVCDAPSQKAFDVSTSSSNINVTGGTLEIIPTSGTALSDATNFLIASTATIGNLLINRASGTSGVQLNTYPLILLGNLNLTTGVFDANSLNVTIGGSFTIASGTTYTTGANTTTFNGLSTQTFTINIASALALNNFTITKAVGSVVNLAGSQTTINILGNFNLTLGTLNDNGDAIYVSQNIYNSGVHAGTGKISLNGSASNQTIDGNGVFQNLELNNTNVATAPISLLANVTINGNLILLQDNLFNIGTYNLKLNSTATIVNGGVNRYIQTAGNSGDGGITKVYSSTVSFTFPIGAPSTSHVGVPKFTPATIGFTTAPSTYGSVTVIPVGYEQPTTTIKGQSLTYFWRVKSSGFTGIAANSTTHTFVYDASDIGAGGSIANYIPSLYDRTNYVWQNGTAASINTGTNTISDWSFSTNYLDADYTAGDNTTGGGAFGTPTVFYSVASANWNNAGTWSNTNGGIGGYGIPGVNDIVVINNNHTVTLAQNQSCASLQIEAGSVLDIYTFSGSVFSMVLNYPSGNNGLFRLTTPIQFYQIFYFPSGDFSDFNVNHGTTEFYDIDGTQGAEYILPPNVSTYGNLILTAKGGDNLILPNNILTTVNGDLTCQGDNPNAWVTMSWQTGGWYYPVVEKTIHITGNFYINNGTFLFLDDAAPQHLVVDGNVTIAPGAVFDTYNEYPVGNGGGPRFNSFNIGGSFINNSNSWPSARFIYGENYVNLTFFGNTNASITSTGGATPLTIFNNVTINKGSSQSTTLTCNIGGNLWTPTDNWLTLQNGTFIYNRTGDFTISTSTNFTIPSTAGLTINTPSNVYIDNNNASQTLYLNGKLTVISGNVYIGPNGSGWNADIEYSGSGASALNIQGGLLNVNGQIRRPLSTTNGILSYSQSGGIVNIYGNNTVANYAKLEVLNDGSVFNMSGGVLNIISGGGTTYGDLFIRPQYSTVTGGLIQFIPQSYQQFSMDASVPLYNLTIDGNFPWLSLMVNPLILNGSFSINNSTCVFDANYQNLSLKGDFTNKGVYLYHSNLTTFNGGAQNILGSTITNFYDLNVSPLTSLTVNNNFKINRNLTIGSGNLVLGNNLITLVGDLINNGSFTDNNVNGASGSGIKLSGFLGQQQITGTGGYGRIDLNNSYGAILNNSISLQNNLSLTLGVLDINQYSLTLSSTSIIEGSSFTSSKMIMSDGVASNLGLTKYFPVISTSTNFTFPIGVSGKYTPAIFTITANANTGNINIVPINAYHPTVTDPTNVLNYYWKISSLGISGFFGTMMLQYISTDAKVTGTNTENNYIASLLLPSNFWDKNAGIVDAVNHQITFAQNGVADITGDYTAGISVAIPDNVPTYQTNKNGVWGDETIWTPINGSPACPAGGPVGSIVIINHEVTVALNYRLAYKTTINGKLKIMSPTFGHNLGDVNGYGTLYVEVGNLPAGNYNTFFNCTGNATIEYGGTGNYTCIATLYNSLPNLVFSGNGTRTLYNKDLTICNKLVMQDQVVVDNATNNRQLTILGTIEIYNTATFLSGSGSTATVTFAGTDLQTVGGATGNFSGANSFNNLQINNSAGLNIGTGGTIEVKNNLLLTNGIISTSSTNKLVIDNTSITAVMPNGGSSTSFVNGPLTKQIVNGDYFLFPLGKGIQQSHNFTLTSVAGASSSINWTVEYFTPNFHPSTSDLTSPLQDIDKLESWAVSASQSYPAQVKIGWNTQSDLYPAMTLNGMADMCIAQFNTTSNQWEVAPGNPITSGTNNLGDISTDANLSISSSSTNLSIGSVTLSRPFARLSPTAAVCGPAGIPVTFTSINPITLNYTLDYTIDGVQQPTVTITSLPYTLPSTTVGTYQLTGFTYNSGGGIGVVSDGTVTTYAIPTTANAGTSQINCNLTSTTLSGNSPTIGAGVWSIASGLGGVIINNVLNTTAFDGVLGSTYSLKWTISNGGCKSSDNVSISFPILATPDFFTEYTSPVCNNSSGMAYSVPSVTGVSYNWSYSGSGATITSANTNSVTIDFSPTATNGTLSVIATLPACGVNTSAPRTLSVQVNSRGTWAGYFDNNWFNTANWTCPSLPISTSDVDIPAGSTLPVINSTGAICNNLTIESGGSLFLTGAGSLNINNSWTNNGTFNASSSSTVNFDGTTAINGTGTNSFGSINITGSLTAPSSNMNIAGDFNNTGTFINNGGTLTFTGANQYFTSTTGIQTLNNVTINNTSNLLFAAGSQVTINNTLLLNGTLTLKAADLTIPTASLILNGTVTNNGTNNIFVERSLPHSRWNEISAMIQGITTSSVTDGNTNRNFYWYDETQPDNWSLSLTTPVALSGWQSVNETTLTPGKGYDFYWYPTQYYSTPYRTYIYNGTNFNTTDITRAVSYTASQGLLYDGWNFIGNPYTSALDWNNAGWDKTSIDGAIYYNLGTNNYAYYVSGGGVNGGSQIIPMGQGFFVHANSGAASLKIPLTARVHNNSVLNYKSGVTMQDNSVVDQLRLQISSNNLFDETLLRFMDGATPDFDSNFDAFKKYTAVSQQPFIYFLTDVTNYELAINSMPPLQTLIDSFEIKLAYRCQTAGTFTITNTQFDFSKYPNIYLYDNVTGTTTNLTTTKTYTFTSDAGIFNKRFTLMIYAPCVWTGAVSNDWNTAANWTNGVPTQNSNVIIPAKMNVTVAQNAVCNNLTVGANTKLLVNTNGNLNVGNNVQLQTDSTGVAQLAAIGKVIVNGVSTMEYYLPLNQAKNISLPFTQVQTIAPIVNMQKYDNTTGLWNNAAKDENYDLNNVYSAVNANKTNVVNVSGTLNFDDKIINPATTSTGLMQVGNPFAANLDWTQINYPTALYKWDAATRNYTYYVNGIGTANPVIAPQDVFMFKPVSGINLTLPRTAQTFSNPRIPLVSGYISIKLTDGTSSDFTYILLNETGATNVIDANKLLSPDLSVAQMYAVSDNANYAIRNIPVLNDDIIVPLGIRLPNINKQFFISLGDNFIEANWNVYIENVSTGESLDVKSGDYVLPQGGDLSNYQMHLTRGVITGVPKIQSGRVKVWSSNKNIYFEYDGDLTNNMNVTVVDVLGREITQQPVNAKTGEAAHDLKVGVYIISFKTSTGVISKKVFVNE